MKKQSQYKTASERILEDYPAEVEFYLEINPGKTPQDLADLSPHVLIALLEGASDELDSINLYQGMMKKQKKLPLKKGGAILRMQLGKLFKR